jgi:hypothetical protein
MNGYAGGCRCGRVRYHLAIDALPLTYACHCHLCQRWSGSAFSQHAVIPVEALTIEGSIETFEITSEGRTSVQRGCAACHGRIYNTNTSRPGLAIVRAGTMDCSEELACVAHIFTRYRQRWFEIPRGVASWSEAPEPDAFLTLVSRPL